MKSAVETLSPTRVRLSVEVPFDELRPSLDAAYRKVAQQVRIKGFRPGKVPPAILDRQVGRGAIIQEAIQDALPQLYGQAVRENDVQVLGHPELEVTEFADGADLKFTAEVDVRPEIELPDYEGLPVTVDDAVVSDEQVDEQLDGLRDRFAVLAAVERPVATGDYVMIDLTATKDGAAVEGGSASGLSYEVGTDGLVPGIDDVLAGMTDGETKSFRTTLQGGEHAGDEVDINVTVRSVKEKQLPDLDDEFAQTASEFDTIDELRGDMRQRLERVRRLEQGMQARDRVLEVLLERVEVPVPEHVFADEVSWRKQNLDQQLQAAGMTKEAYAQSQDQTVDELDEEITESARQAIKAQFVLEAVAQKEEFGVTEPELTDQIVMRAQRSGVSPDQLARQIVESGQLGALAGEVLRAKALALLLEHATVTDASGRPVDLGDLREDGTEAEAVVEDTAEDAPRGETSDAE